MSGRLIILAGGISSRMKETAIHVSTEDKLIKDAQKKAKSMIRVGLNNRPFLDYLLYNASNAGINDAVIVIGEKDDSIKYYYENEYSNKFCDVNISYAIQRIPEGRFKPLGTAEALYVGLLSRPDWKRENFLMCNSDNLYSMNCINRLLNSPYLNAMIDYDLEGLVFEKERIGKFAVTKKDDENFLIDIIEKPSIDVIEDLKIKDGFVGVSMNIFKFNYDMIMPILKDVPVNKERDEKEIPTAVKILINQFPKSMYACRVKEYVPDLSSKNDISVVQEYINKEFANVKFE